MNILNQVLLTQAVHLRRANIPLPDDLKKVLAESTDEQRMTTEMELASSEVFIEAQKAKYNLKEKQ